MRMLAAAGERCRGARLVAAYADVQWGREMSSEDLQCPSMVHRAWDTCDLEVAPVDDEHSLRVCRSVQPDHGAVYLVQRVGTKSFAQAFAKQCLHGLQQPLELAGLDAIEGNRGDQLRGHPTELSRGDCSTGRAAAQQHHDRVARNDVMDQIAISPDGCGNVRLCMMSERIRLRCDHLRR